MREKERWRHRQREKQAPCGEPDEGLNPRTPGSRPEPKADAQPLSHAGVPPSWSYLKETLSEACLLHFEIFYISTSPEIVILMMDSWKTRIPAFGGTHPLKDFTPPWKEPSTLSHVIDDKDLIR
ncbi:hypothetical protein VULLAG_LOCUS19161 [Vulpes lagopus]